MMASPKAGRSLGSREVTRFRSTTTSARAEGVEVTANQYQYTAMNHPWAALLPRWVQDAPRQKTIARFAERSFRDRVKQDAEFRQYVGEHVG